MAAPLAKSEFLRIIIFGERFKYHANSFVLKMVSTYYNCCKYSNGLQNTSTIEAYSMNPIIETVLLSTLTGLDWDIRMNVKNDGWEIILKF